MCEFWRFTTWAFRRYMTLTGYNAITQRKLTSKVTAEKGIPLNVQLLPVLSYISSRWTVQGSTVYLRVTYMCLWHLRTRGSFGDPSHAKIKGPSVTKSYKWGSVGVEAVKIGVIKVLANLDLWVKKKIRKLRYLRKKMALRKEGSFDVSKKKVESFGESTPK